jgi:hypothetical protein
MSSFIDLCVILTFRSYTPKTCSYNKITPPKVKKLHINGHLFQQNHVSKTHFLASTTIIFKTNFNAHEGDYCAWQLPFLGLAEGWAMELDSPSLPKFDHASRYKFVAQCILMCTPLGRCWRVHKVTNMFLESKIACRRRP